MPGMPPITNDVPQMPMDEVSSPLHDRLASFLLYTSFKMMHTQGLQLENDPHKLLDDTSLFVALTQLVACV